MARASGHILRTPCCFNDIPSWSTSHGSYVRINVYMDAGLETDGHVSEALYTLQAIYLEHVEVN